MTFHEPSGGGARAKRYFFSNIFFRKKEVNMRRLTIVAINDVYELANFPSLKTLVESVMRSRKNRVITCLAGDFLAPSILSSMDKGLGMVECLNRIPVSHVCFGNHEGDYGMGVLKVRQSIVCC